MSREARLLNAVLSAENPTASFVNRITDLAAGVDRKRAIRATWRRRLRLSFGGVSLAAIATVAFMLEPRAAFAMMLRGVQSKLNAQAAVHYKVWTIMPDGTRVVAQEVWHQGDIDKIVRGEGATIVRQGSRQWTFDPASTQVLVHSDSFSRGFGSFRGADMLHDFESSSWLAKVQTEDLGAQTVTSVIGRNERTRLRLYIDKATDLPAKVEIQSPRGDGWKTVQEGAFDFAPPGRKLELAALLPHDLPVVDLATAEAQIRSQWQTALYQYKGTRIYDVQMNNRGDVFVVFSGGDIRLSSPNREYVASSNSDEFQPVMHWLNSDRVEGFTSPGGDLRGKVFTPLHGGGQTPVDLNIVIQHPKSNYATPQEGHRTQLKDGRDAYAWTAQEYATAVAKHDANAPDLDKRTFRLRGKRPSCAVLPSYMPFMPMPITSEAALSVIDSRARAGELELRGDYAGAELEIRGQIQSFELECLQFGSPGVQPEAYMQLYDVLAAQGKHAEAIDALKRVPDQLVYKNDDLEGRLRLAMLKEGLR